MVNIYQVSVLYTESMYKHVVSLANQVHTISNRRTSVWPLELKPWSVEDKCSTTVGALCIGVYLGVGWKVEMKIPIPFLQKVLPPANICLNREIQSHPLMGLSC